MFVKRWMTKDLITVCATNTVYEAMTLMEERKIRRLPIVDEEGLLVGILSKEDILNALPSVIDPSSDETTRALAVQAEVGSFMSCRPVTVSPEDPLENAAYLMRKHKIGGIPVMQDGKLVGILSESDIFRAFTEIFGDNTEGVRVELAIEPTSAALHSVFKVLKEHHVTLTAVNLCNDFSKTQHLLTLRMLCEDDDQVIDALWDAGLQVTSVLNRA